MKTLSRLLGLVAPFARWMVLAALLGALTVASSVCLMALSAYLVSLSALHPSVADLGVAIVAVRFFGLARGVGRYLERYVSHTVTFRILTRLRVWFYSALEPLAPARLMQFQAGDLLGRAVGDIETLQEFFVWVLSPPAVALLVFFGICVWLWSFSLQLALAVLGGLVLTGVLLPLGMSLAARAPAKLAVARRAELNARLVDAIQGVPDIVAYGQAQRFSATIRNAAQAHAGAQSRLVWLGAFQSGVGTLLAHGTAWVMLILSIGLVNEGLFSGVYLAALVLATAASFEAVLPLPAAAQALQLALHAARRLFAVVDVRQAVSDSVVAQPLPTATSLIVRDLRFAYAPDATPALDGISFVAEFGRRLAIVGPSGAGKSTLVHLLMRFWDYTDGEITLGGTPLNELKAADVRSVISLITQQPYLFNGTIYENLRIARPDASRADILRASAQSQLHDFVSTLPQGYDTQIGERGAMLSGGERQRIAIARVLLRNTPIVILDEPTANLDAVTERHFLQALFAVMQGRTLVLITHRLIGLDQMDEILVMQHGQIIERGTQVDLLRKAGLYHKLWLLQNERLG